MVYQQLVASITNTVVAIRPLGTAYIVHVYMPYGAPVAPTAFAVLALRRLYVTVATSST
jgi:hypothetical protein